LKKNPEFWTPPFYKPSGRSWKTFALLTCRGRETNILGYKICKSRV